MITKTKKKEKHQKERIVEEERCDSVSSCIDRCRNCAKLKKKKNGNIVERHQVFRQKKLQTKKKFMTPGTRGFM